MTSKTKRRAVFLDRDGVINHAGKVDRADEFHMIDCIPEAMRSLKQADLLLVITTNQGGLGEDFDGNVVWEKARLNRQDLAEIHAKMLGLLGPDASPDLIKFCPHANWDYDCHCHKPKPGMLLDAAAELNIDLPRSWMVGDRFTDMEAAIAAGVTPILVLTGESKNEIEKCPSGTIVIPSLKEAAQFILAQLAAELA